MEMLERGAKAAHVPSAYWREELSGFEYMLDAPPLVVTRLREHCYHLTGLRSYDYRAHHRHKSRPFAEKLASLKAVDRSQLFVPEPAILGGFGHELDEGLVNVDTLKFYEALIALDHSGALASLRARGGDGSTVLEIGAGWGGFAYDVRRLFPKVRQAIVDLPESLLFSATYLMTAFPDAEVRFAGGGSGSPIPDVPEGGFLFVPHFDFERLSLPALDLAVNMCSFQEMTTEQVRGYARGLCHLGARAVYSLNRDRSSHNPELTSVSETLAESWEVSEVHVLEAPYTTLGVVRPWSSAAALRDRPVTEYRHLIGRRA